MDAQILVLIVFILLAGTGHLRLYD